MPVTMLIADELPEWLTVYAKAECIICDVEIDEFEPSALDWETFAEEHMGCGEGEDA